MSSYINNIGKPWFAIGGIWTAYRLLTQAPPPVPEASNQPWRPPQWNRPQLYMLSLTQKDPSSDETTTVDYFFDATLRSEHELQLRRTEHPIQTGANVSDHAYMMPNRVVLEIGMSDVMDRYIASLYTGNSSKSVSAFQTLKALQQSRQPMTLTTRLYTYQNMLIDSIRAVETNKTRFGLRAYIVFGQLLTGYITSEKISARPQSTDETPQGTTTPEEPDNSYVDYQFVNNGPDNVPGAGGWSSFGSKYQIQTGIASGGVY